MRTLLRTPRAFVSGAILQFIVLGCSSETPAFVATTKVDSDSRAPVDGLEPEGGRHKWADAKSISPPRPEDAGRMGEARPIQDSPNGQDKGDLSKGTPGQPGLGAADLLPPVLDPSDNRGGAERPRPIRSYEFAVEASRVIDGSLHLKDGWITQPIVLEAKTETEALTFAQEERPLLKSRFVQGQDGRAYTESFDQEDVQGVLDVALVIDNSASMKEEQKNLSSKLLPLIQEVADADWRIGVVTTDASEGCLRELIKKSDPDPQALFERAVKAGINGSGNEEGFLQAVNVLSCSQASWVRDSSTVAVLIVSDEDNCSDGRDCEDKQWRDEGYLLNHLEKKMGRSLGQTARVYGIIKHPSDKSCTTAYNDGFQYARAVKATQGAWGSICAKDYSSTLARISADIATILRSQFALQAEPDPETVEVTAVLSDGRQTQLSGYTIRGNVISFATPPPLGSRVVVSYKTYPEGQLAEWNLGDEPLLTSLVVTTEDGGLVPQDEYRLEGANLVFWTAPSPGTVLEASFKKNSPLNRAFALQGVPLEKTLAVSVNGVQVDNFIYGPDGFVVFDDAPAERSQIHVTYEKIMGPKIEYPFLNMPTAVQDLRAQYSDHSIVSISLVDSGNHPMIRLSNPAEARIGETLWVQYRQGKEAPIRIALPETPLAGTLQISSTHNSCLPGAGIVAENSSIVINCKNANDFRVNFAFESETQATRAFELPIIDGVHSEHRVFVDGKALMKSDFFIEGGRLIIGDVVDLGYQSTVRLEIE